MAIDQQEIRSAALEGIQGYRQFLELGRETLEIGSDDQQFAFRQTAMTLGLGLLVQARYAGTPEDEEEREFVALAREVGESLTLLAAVAEAKDLDTLPLLDPDTVDARLAVLR